MPARSFPTSCMPRSATAVALAAATLAFPVPALAAPCGGFTDVDDTTVSADFCKAVDWLKNRQITLGCTTATLYCPNADVTRLAMAAFMNRLGDRLTPSHNKVDANPGALDLDASPVVCQTADIPIVPTPPATTTYPRRAFVDLTFSATATADVSFAADLVMSTNGGTTWTNLNANPNRGSVPANQWGGLSDLAYADLDPGQTVRFGVKASRGGIASATDLTNSVCEMRVLVYSRTGASSPF